MSNLFGLSRQRRLGARARIVQLLAVALMAAGLSVLQPAGAQALPSNHGIASWNMQGSSQLGENIWFQITRLLQLKDRWGAPKIEVMALQEVGLVPDGTTGTGPISSFVVNALWTGTPYSVAEYAWAASRRSPTYYIYYLGLKGDGHLNVAFVTRARVAAADFRVIPPVPLASGVTPAANRPMMGVRLDATTFFWTGHARPEGFNGIPLGGNDADHMMDAIDASGQSAHWVFAGDLNREPKSLIAPGGSTTIWSKFATHQGGSVLDYVVTNDAPANLADYNVVVEKASGSDHWPISAGVGMVEG
ncbi:endonuclease/exonuclease/phosphatase family protein [Lentzea sp. NPDC004782]|uniref:endonuclease/exonuclease/phosphatase family protein n=1 Tax=Lentzea sp. NPDC004782 TaxID=3154458 RepID=UPI0033AB35B9